jgi:glycosyltransferase involved in cell wall biosynthesis
MKPFLSVIVPAHNEEAYIELCLNSLLKQDYGLENYEIIVVDNNSTDATKKIIERFSGVKYLFKKDGPVGAVRNYGAKESQGEYLVFIDGDCLAPEVWLSRGINLLLSSTISAFGGRYDLEENASWIERYWLLGDKNRQSKHQDLLGGAIFISKSDFLQVNGFDETITSGEDTKLTRDLKAIGKEVVIYQDLNVVHLGNAKTVKSFIMRQAWHSENYLKTPLESIKDPTFILTVLFSCALIFSLTSLTFFSIEFSIFGLIFALAIPNVFSIKRITRSGSANTLVKHYPKIYIIDLLYMLGRTAGLGRALKKAIK